MPYRDKHIFTHSLKFKSEILKFHGMELTHLGVLGQAEHGILVRQMLKGFSYKETVV